jgi:hypothetical protein
VIHEVILILRRDFEGDLWSLSREAHVWIIQSPENSLAVQAVRERETEGYSPLRGVTSFTGGDDVSADFYDLLSVIDCHHNQSAAPRPWDKIHVIGMPRRITRRKQVAEVLGVPVAIDYEPQAFTIRRAEQ